MVIEFNKNQEKTKTEKGKSFKKAKINRMQITTKVVLMRMMS